jgi:hypothetical protein
MKYFKYLNYLLKHKWYVTIECFSIGLYWRGLIHDLSKFLPSEFIPYANYFYGEGHDISRGRNSTGYYKPTETGDLRFEFAWLLHQKRNKHHWQYWVIPKEAGFKVYEIPLIYRREMLCDWIGAGKAQGKFSPKNDYLFETRNWWTTNKDKMTFAPDTLKYFELLLD